MSALQIFLFGTMRVTHNSGPTRVILSRELRGLLAYFLVHRYRLHSREVLAETFWAEHSQEKARGSLNTALWKLKKALEPTGVAPGTYLKKSLLGEVGFNLEGEYWLDVEVFEKEVSNVLACPLEAVTETQVTGLQKAMELYKGELLEGYYKDWALRERERLRALYVNALFYLMRYYALHRHDDKAIATGQQILSLDPLREEIHRELMRLYLHRGERALAVRQYEICCSTLAKELGISPMEGTQSLYSQIMGRLDTGTPQVDSETSTDMDDALRQILQASQAIDVARAQIQQVLQTITLHHVAESSLISRPSDAGDTRRSQK